VLRKRLDHWTFRLGPEFWQKEPQAVKLSHDLLDSNKVLHPADHLGLTNWIIVLADISRTAARALRSLVPGFIDQKKPPRFNLQHSLKSAVYSSRK
jgi:hypothetical protein